MSPLELLKTVLSSRKSASSLGLALWRLPPNVRFQVSGCYVRFGSEADIIHVSDLVR